MAPALTLLDVISRPPPTPWAEGDNIPWDDPEFSARMLREHLSQAHDLASRRSEIIARHVDWLHRQVLEGRPARILDLGCGPGLYLHALARLGHHCEGIDFGPASIEYGREVAAAEGLDCVFRLEDLRHAHLGERFDLIAMVFGQLNVFRRGEAADLVRRARAALAPGGRLVLEVQSLETVRADGSATASWSSAREGLFSDRPHLTLHERVWDEHHGCAVDRWYVVDAESGAVARMALTTEAYTREELRAMLAGSGLERIELLAALPGSPDASMFGVVARAPAR